MDTRERNLEIADVIDIPVPSDELQLTVDDTDTLVKVDEISQQAGHFSASYRRC